MTFGFSISSAARTVNDSPELEGYASPPRYTERDETLSVSSK